MKNLVRAALLLLTLPAFAADDAVPRRLVPIVGDDRLYALTYRTYASGRPRLVVAAVQRESVDHDEFGEVLLIRFPDSPDGRPSVLDHLPIDWLPVQIELVRAIEPDDILVTCKAPHTPPGMLYRVAGQRLVKIAELGVYLGFLTPDLDGDGIPEIFSTGCCDGTVCGVGISIGVQKYDGTRYRSDGRNYIEYIPAQAGDAPFEKMLHLPRDPQPGKTRRCRFVIVNEGAVAARVQFDGKDLIAPERLRNFRRVERTLDVTIALSAGDCHTLRVSAKGPAGGVVHVLVEELP